jgi:hypothetical protein
MQLYDLAEVMRSKNAGPFTLTIDIQCNSLEDYDRVLASPEFSVENIALLYGMSASAIAIHPFTAIRTIKVTMPRAWASSGAPGDRDVYGCQQHFPLGEIFV